MAVTITRTAWIDDDGTGTTGTVINNAVKTDLYNQIDGALAKVAQLTGGNSFTGNQAIDGLLSVTKVGAHLFTGVGAGINEIRIANGAPGADNLTMLTLGTDTVPQQAMLVAMSSTYVPVAYNFPNGTSLIGQGSGGLNLATSVNAPVRLFTNSAERLRIAGNGDVLIGGIAVNPALGLLALAADLSAHQGILVQNTSPGNTGYFGYFLNSAAAACGSIQQSGATGVSFVTTSDARLKRDASRATDLTALRAVTVYDFTWTPDGRPDRGVFAQEARAVFPRAIAPGTDDTTDGGALAHPWGTDYSKFVPDLIVGWQQHGAEIADLRAQLATLKGSPDAQ
jgi:Chaperone of endosialidase